MSEEHDEALARGFALLEPSDEARARMRRAVLRAHRASNRPLAYEWLELVRSRPVTGVAMLAAAAAALVIAGPVGLLLGLLRMLA